MDNSITACLIVKNEADYLGDCLASLKPFVNQIIVIDTGSTDQTLAIARGFSAHCETILWSDDFSAARNYALKYATSQWVLHIDADERVPEVSANQIIQKLDQLDPTQPHLLFFSYVQAHGKLLKRALHSNHSGFYFKGQVHEYLTNHRDFQVIECPEIQVLHLTKARQFSKHAYYTKLIKKELKAEPNIEREMVLNWHLYLSLSFLGHDSSTALEKAWMGLLRKGVKHTQFDYVLSYTFLTRVLFNGSPLKYIQEARTVVSVFSDSFTLNLLLGSMLLYLPNSKSLDILFRKIKGLHNDGVLREEVVDLFYARYFILCRQPEKAYALLSAKYSENSSSVYFLFLSLTAFLNLSYIAFFTFLLDSGIAKQEHRLFMQKLQEFFLFSNHEKKMLRNKLTKMK